jgi:hypothetical protein
VNGKVTRQLFDLRRDPGEKSSLDDAKKMAELEALLG